MTSSEGIFEDRRPSNTHEKGFLKNNHEVSLLACLEMGVVSQAAGWQGWFTRWW
jgi:hypothetical protein